MFQHRKREFEPRIAALKGQIRKIESDLDSAWRTTGRTNDVGTTATTASQIVDAIVPILSQVIEHFTRNPRVTVDEVANFGKEATRIGSKIGTNAFEQIATRTKERPLLILAVAVGVGILVGIARRRR
jgi:hypothetical protein